MSTALTTLTRDFNGNAFVFRDTGWFNMTKAAKHFGKHLTHFWDATETREYLVALADASETTRDSVEFGWKACKDHFVYTTTGRNGGTLAHPKLAVFFARWLDVKFAVWCDAMIDDILKGKAIARPGGLREVVITKPQESAVRALPWISGLPVPPSPPLPVAGPPGRTPKIHCKFLRRYLRVNARLLSPVPPPPAPLDRPERGQGNRLRKSVGRRTGHTR